jgi:hypothetical protein
VLAATARHATPLRGLEIDGETTTIWFEITGFFGT